MRLVRLYRHGFRLGFIGSEPQSSVIATTFDAVETTDTVCTSPATISMVPQHLIREVNDFLGCTVNVPGDRQTIACSTAQNHASDR